MIDRTKFMASLALAGLLSTTTIACGGSEPVEEEAMPEDTTGSETTTTPEPVYQEATPEEPMETEEDLGPTPE